MSPAEVHVIGASGGSENEVMSGTLDPIKRLQVLWGDGIHAYLYIFSVTYRLFPRASYRKRLYLPFYKMFFWQVIFLLIADLAHAQIPNLPSCSLTCFINAMSHDGCTSLTDFACHCRRPQLITEVTPCVQQACNKQQQSAVSNAVVTQCPSAGVPISIPPVSGSTTQTNPTTSVHTTITAPETSITPSGPVVTLPTSTEPSAPIQSSSSVPSSSSQIEPSYPSPSSPPFYGGADALYSGGRLAGVAAAVVAGHLV
ncbi:hypothetical protein BJX99DRAFT_76552 [Aspergillus californicus]